MGFNPIVLKIQVAQMLCDSPKQGNGHECEIIWWFDEIDWPRMRTRIHCARAISLLLVARAGSCILREKKKEGQFS